jgi:hypothetical protein
MAYLKTHSESVGEPLLKFKEDLRVLLPAAANPQRAGEGEACLSIGYPVVNQVLESSLCDGVDILKRPEEGQDLRPNIVKERGKARES